MEACLVVIGLNFRTAPVEVRERFWMSEERRLKALEQLTRMDGIQEAVVLVTCNRTEFILWARDFSAAANSVLAFLNREFALRLCEWKHFYRLLGIEALAQVFRVASSLDSMAVGEPPIVGLVKSAWAQAQEAGGSGRFLDAIFHKALAVSQRVRTDTGIAASAVSIPYAAVELAKEILGSLADRRALVLGTGRMGEISARYLANSGVASLKLANRTLESAQELAKTLGGEAVAFEERWPALLEADVVISSTGCPHAVITREEAERIAHERQGRSICFIDIAVPRDVDPAVRHIPGVFLYDMDDVQKVVERNRRQRQAATAAAELLVAAEVAAFDKELAAESVVPTLVALREKLDDISREELERYEREFGPLSESQREAFQALGNMIVHHITGSLARELKAPETTEQEKLTSAVRRLFDLDSPGNRQPFSTRALHA